MSVPARRILVENLDASESVYLRINGSPAVASASFIPGDNIKIKAGCTFSIDFDAITEISLVSAAGKEVSISGVLGFKGSIST